MLVAIDARTRTPVQAAKVAARSELDAPHLCPECGARVVAKLGSIKVWHFAHIANTACTGAGGESEMHANAKAQIVAALARHPRVSLVGAEVVAGDQRADVLAWLKSGERVAIELQATAIDAAEIDARTRGYAEQGIFAVWICPYPPPTFDIQEAFGAKLRPSRAEGFMHAMHRERLYFWASGGTVTCATLHVHATLDTGSAEHGYREEAEGDDKIIGKAWAVPMRKASKDLRTALVLPRPLCLIDDFAPARRSAFAWRGHLRGDFALWQDTAGGAWEVPDVVSMGQNVSAWPIRSARRIKSGELKMGEGRVGEMRLAWADAVIDRHAEQKRQRRKTRKLLGITRRQPLPSLPPAPPALPPVMSVEDARLAAALAAHGPAPKFGLDAWYACRLEIIRQHTA